MSDVSQGPGWWQASDGKWYPPEQAPAAQAPAAQMPAAQMPAAQAPGGYPTAATPGPLADWGTRVLATLIDWAASWILVIAGIIVAFIIGAISTTLGLLVGLVVYAAAAALGFYFAYMNGACGQSPGKKVMGIKVVSEETGQVIGGGLGIVRALAHFVDGIIFYIGFLFPLWDPKRQTLADKIMKTVVLSGQPKQALSPELLKVR
jgi:uncharacterized RDD family membrane protein YckC